MQDLYEIKKHKLSHTDKDIDWSEFYKNLSVLNELKQIIEDKGGKLISEQYINNRTHVTVQCDKNHAPWGITPNDIKTGKWCPHCAGRHRTIDDMHQWAKDRGAICLSEEYIDAHTKLKWKCKCGGYLK